MPRHDGGSPARSSTDCSGPRRAKSACFSSSHKMAGPREGGRLLFRRQAHIREQPALHGTMGYVGQSRFSWGDSQGEDYNSQNAWRDNSSRAPKRRDLTEGVERASWGRGSAEVGGVLPPALATLKLSGSRAALQTGKCEGVFSLSKVLCLWFYSPRLCPWTNFPHLPGKVKVILDFTTGARKLPGLGGLLRYLTGLPKARPDSKFQIPSCSGAGVAFLHRQ